MTVSVILPAKFTEDAQVSLARYAIQTMREQTDVPFELVVIEAGSREMESLADVFEPGQGGNYVRDFNQGLRAATGEYRVHTGIDILMGAHWLEALLACFQNEDCGVASLACSEPGATVGPREPIPMIVEGWYGPLMLFRKGWELDDAYTGMHSDTDLVMRVYESGKRAYRNCEVVCHHLDGVTFKAENSPERRREIQAEADAIFRARWVRSPLTWPVMMALRGGVLFGREHEGLTSAT